MCELDYFDTCDVWEERERRARKEHRCDGCEAVIKTGTVYINHFSLFEGEPQTAKMCIYCRATRDAFGDSHGHVLPFPGSLRETLEECITDGDEESERVWRPALEAMDERKRSIPS